MKILQLRFQVRRDLPPGRCPLLSQAMLLPDEPAWKKPPYGGFSPLGFLLGILGQGLSLRNTQRPLTGNIAEYAGQELGRERQAARVAEEGVA